MTQTQIKNLQAVLRDRPALDPDLTLAEQRAFFEQITSTAVLPAGTATAEGRLGGVPVVHTTHPETESGPDAPVVLYLHGGGFVVGSARSGTSLTAGLASRARGRGVSVGYRLAPEHPFPAAVEDTLAVYRALLDEGTAPSRVAFAGDSAGGGLALQALVAARDAGLPLPAATVAFSPWYDLTLSGASITSRAGDDPILTPHMLRRYAADYLGAAAGAPALDDLRGLPPLLVQAGSHEIVLDDAVALASRAAADDVPVELEVTAGATHVFQRFAGSGLLDEADAALDSAGTFLRRALSPALAAAA
ncbi:alpha/beta hydrolase [Streptomyces sp. NRRL F-5123]|uniref:alpha/beta hydrolase n=1 Tax=Streptomyces sp. NRRL F-5123 TaxID=1463856 RepID=UPI0004E0E8DC|nr:alpha/beta hydrolase [Streptomyces sp. NRRL F-5123]